MEEIGIFVEEIGIFMEKIGIFMEEIGIFVEEIPLHRGNLVNSHCTLVCTTPIFTYEKDSFL